MSGALEKIIKDAKDELQKENEEIGKPEPVDLLNDEDEMDIVM